MDNDHRKCLEVLCRLCGEAKAIPQDRLPTAKERLSDIIQASFGFDVMSDLVELHPPFICKSCDLKLRKWWTKSKKRGKARLPCNITLASFEEDRCENCGGSASSLMSNGRMEEWKEEGIKHGLIAWQGADKLQFMRLNKDGRPVLYLSIFMDLRWKLEVSGVHVKDDSHICRNVPAQLNGKAAQNLLKKVATLNVCEANADFGDLIKLITLDGHIPTKVTASDIYSDGAIRHIKCHLLCDIKKRCNVCHLHRSELNKALSRQRAKVGQVVSPSLAAPNKSLSMTQLKVKVSLLQSDRQKLKRRLNNVQERVNELLKEESVPLDAPLDTAMKEIAEECGDTLSDILGKETPAGLMWQQQREAVVKGKQMRWHPAIIRWCIALHSKSSSGYNILRQTGFLKLPHPSTLHSYTHFTNPTTGLNPSMLHRIVQDSNMQDDLQRNVSILFDEMKVKAGLVFSVRSGKVIGFTDITSITNEVADFERKCRGEVEPVVATHVLVLMIRGIFSSLDAPLAYYATTGVTSDQLYLCMYEAILFLETAGFQVRALVSDGASPNRKFYRIQSTTASEVPTFSTVNPFDPTRKIFFFCDVPHLLKTTRNNWENSGWNNNTRTLCLNKQEVSWKHLLQLYEWDTGLDRSSPGLRRLHKLTYEHLHLTPSLRMRVYMAAQVLSSTVANAFESLGKVGTDSTVKFIRYIDQFFDCLNVSNVHKGAHCRKPALAPYKSPDDWRFTWLVKDFLGFLDAWQAEVDSHQELDKATRKKMILSKETMEGFKITVHSFVELGQLLLKLPGVKYLLSEKFCQDPLEQYFSKQRGAGGSSDNPTVEQFGHLSLYMLSLYVSQGCVKASRKGNCRLKDREDDSRLLDSTPLPRRK